METVSDIDKPRMIVLTKGQATIVDAADFKWLSSFNWCARWSQSTKSYYAHRQYPRDAEKKQKGCPMHRFILGLVPGDGFIGDHINRNTLDNRRSNLRIVTPTQSIANRRVSCVNKSGFTGVSRSEYGKPWKAIIVVRGKSKWLGTHATAELAAEAYAAAVKLYHGI